MSDSAVTSSGCRAARSLPAATAPLRRLASRRQLPVVPARSARGSIVDQNTGTPAARAATVRALMFSVAPRPAACAASDGIEDRSEEHTSELQSHLNLVCRLL